MTYISCWLFFRCYSFYWTRPHTKQQAHSSDEFTYSAKEHNSPIALPPDLISGSEFATGSLSNFRQ